MGIRLWMKTVDTVSTASENRSIKK